MKKIRLNNLSKLFFVLIVGIIFSNLAFAQSSGSGSAAAQTGVSKPKETNDGTVCTMEVMQCPDGSYVGRTGPNCEFAPCPALQQPPSGEERPVAPPGVISIEWTMPQSVGRGGVTPSGVCPEGCTCKKIKKPIAPTGEKPVSVVPHVGEIPPPSGELPPVATEQEMEQEIKRQKDAAASVSDEIWVACPTKIQKVSPNELLIESGSVSVKSSEKIEMKQQKLMMKTSQGEKEIKVMPSVASEIAINQLKLKNYEIELKDVGKPVYEIKGTKEGKFLGIFKKDVAVTSIVNAETGAIEETKRPWWSFLVR